MSRIAVPSSAGWSAVRTHATTRTTLMVVGAALLARLLALEVGGLAFLYLPHAWLQEVAGYQPPAGNFWFQTLVGPWAHWDGYWYLSIAHLGYAGRPLAAAFFPLYPYLLRLLGDSVLLGLLFSVACYTGGAVLLYRLAEAELSSSAAWGAVLALAFFPTAFYYNALYPEALVLLLSVASFSCARQRRYGWAGVLAGVAGFASVDALFLGIPLLYYLWSRREPWARWLTLGLVPSGVLAFMGLLQWRFHNALQFQSVQGYWGRALHAPWFTGAQAVVQFRHYLPLVLSFRHLYNTHQPVDSLSNVWNLVFLVAAIFLMVLAIRRLPAPYWLYALGILLLPVFDPSAGVPLMSFPRLMLAAWPLFMGLGDWFSRRPRAIYPYLWLAGASGAVLISLFATAHWVA